MSRNHELDEKENHEHYYVCRGRLADIERYCTGIFMYVLVSSLVLVAFVLLGFRIPVISWIPALVAGDSELAPIFLQFIVIAGVVLLSILGYGKRKMCNVILLVIYATMLVFSFITMKNPFVDYEEFIGCGIGLMGTLRCCKAFSIMSDYEQLRETEGYPHFNERLIETVDESRSYVPQHDRSCYSAGTDNSMAAPETVRETSFTGNNDTDAMDSMPELVPLTPPPIPTPPPVPSPAPVRQPASAPGTVPEREPKNLFEINETKFCRISESPIKTM